MQAIAMVFPFASRSMIAAITAPKVILPDESKGHSGSRQILTLP
jgi:hypothetical protein